MEFLVVIVSTILLILGVVGRGASARSGSFSFTVSGTIGPVPGVILVVVGIFGYVVAGVFFLALPTGGEQVHQVQPPHPVDKR